MTRVLVIDDDAELRDALRSILEGAGYSVDLAADGELGMILQRARPADIVITDIFMPNQDGIETVSRLRSEFPEARVIAMSGGGAKVKSGAYLSTAGQIGAHALLRKPFQPDELLNAVRGSLLH
jgi:CheY-like chemotaxis protein